LNENRENYTGQEGAVETELSRYKREKEVLLKAAGVILKHTSFEESAKEIFEFCKGITGAQSGYVALLSDDGSENEVLFLDSGGRPCTVDPNLPMPIRGLREIAYRENRTVYENDFEGSEWQKFMPAGHVTLNNVLFGPLILNGQAVGLIGLANKPSDFTDRDASMVGALGELAAIALEKSHRTEELRRTKTELELYTSFMRHDLRNDLQLVLAYLEEAQIYTKDTKNQELKASVTRSINAVERMTRLLNAMKSHQSDWQGPVVAVVEHTAKQAEDSHQNLTVSVNSNESVKNEEALGGSLMPLVLDNIFRNAAQHAGPEPHVDVRVTRSGDYIRIDCIDDGPGIPPNKQENLFERGSEGSIGGLGLYLSKKLVEAFDGSLKLVQDQYPDCGAAFRIELPIRK